MRTVIPTLTNRDSQKSNIVPFLKYDAQKRKIRDRF